MLDKTCFDGLYCMSWIVTTALTCLKDIETPSSTKVCSYSFPWLWNWYDIPHTDAFFWPHLCSQATGGEMYGNGKHDYTVLLAFSRMHFAWLFDIYGCLLVTELMVQRLRSGQEKKSKTDVFWCDHMSWHQWSLEGCFTMKVCVCFTGVSWQPGWKTAITSSEPSQINTIYTSFYNTLRFKKKKN